MTMTACFIFCEVRRGDAEEGRVAALIGGQREERADAVRERDQGQLVLRTTAADYFREQGAGAVELLAGFHAVAGIEQDREADRLGIGAEEGDFLGMAVFGQGKVLRGESADRVRLLVGDVDGDGLEIGVGFELGRERSQEERNVAEDPHFSSF
jgi:hypothetical protein